MTDDQNDQREDAGEDQQSHERVQDHLQRQEEVAEYRCSQRDEQRGHHRIQRERLRRRAQLPPRGLIAQHLLRANCRGPDHGKQSEDQRCDDADGNARQHGAGGDLEDEGCIDHLLDQRLHDQTHRDAGGRAEHPTEEAEDRHLQSEHGVEVATPVSRRLEHRNFHTPAREHHLERVDDSDSANRQCEKADDLQVLRHLLRRLHVRLERLLHRLHRRSRELGLQLARHVRCLRICCRGHLDHAVAFRLCAELAVCRRIDEGG